MLSLKLVRSLVLGDTINITSNSFLSNSNASSDSAGTDGDDDGHSNDNGDLHDRPHQSSRKSKTKRKAKTIPLLIFLPTHEIVNDTYRLCTIARDMGMNLHPNPSLSHIIFSWPSPPQPSPSPTSTSASIPSLWSSTSTSTWSLSNDFVPLPFPSLVHASTTHLQCFVNLTKGLFKLVFSKFKKPNGVEESINNWDCSSLSLFSRVSGDRIDSMDCFMRVLAGMGWTMYKTKSNPYLVSGNFGSAQPICVYLFRKIEPNRVETVRSNGSDTNLGRFRIRELRLPTLDFRNAPLRILQYILLMTDNIFYLA